MINSALMTGPQKILSATRSWSWKSARLPKAGLNMASLLAAARNMILTAAALAAGFRIARRPLRDVQVKALSKSPACRPACEDILPDFTQRAKILLRISKVILKARISFCAPLMAM